MGEQNVNGYRSMEYDAENKSYNQNLVEIPSGWYVCSNLCTQARFTGRFRILENTDSMTGHVLISGNKTDSNVDFHIIESTPPAAYYTGTNLRLEVSVDTSYPLKTFYESMEVKDSGGNKVGVVYVFCFEDYTDNDYNDFVFTISAWKKKG